MPETRNLCDYCGEVVVHSCPPQPNSFGELNRALRELEQRFNRKLDELVRQVENLRVVSDE